MKRIFLAVVAVTLVAAGCSKSNESTTVAPASGKASFTLGTVPKTVDGNVLTIPVTVQGIKIVAANGDTSGKTGHFHIFIDKTPPAVGSTIPKEPGIVHYAQTPIKLFGLKIGTHTLHIVLGDGLHRRLPGDEQTVSVDVKGPSVWGTAPSTIKSGEALTVELHSAGFEVMPVSGSDSAMTHESASPTASGMQQGHYHVLVDPATPPKAGETLPMPEKDKVIHTGASSVTINGLTAGAHNIWIVAGSLSHVAFDPPVMDRLIVTVTP